MEKYQSEISVASGDSTTSPEDEFYDIQSSGRKPYGSVDDPVGHHGLLERSNVTVDRLHASVQRSKSDVRHNCRPAALLHEQRRGSNFELAYLLQKGRTLDAKLFGEESTEEEEEEQPRLRRGSSEDGSSSSVSAEGGGGRIVLLPLRLRQALTKRRCSTSRIYPPRTPICGSLQGSTASISGPLDSLPELQPSEMLSQQNSTVACSQAQKNKDTEAAILWLQQEIRSLKTQDRKLFRQLLGLGTEVHRLSGMKTCQSVNNSLDDDADVASPCFDENAANHNYVDHEGNDYLTQSLDNAWQMKSTSEANNLKSNKLLDLYSSSDSFFL